MSQQPRLLFGASPAMAELQYRAARFAGTSDPILILGERGTGKTRLAYELHKLSGRQDVGTFKEQSVPALIKGLELTSLIGHARGAFTGANEDRAGLLEAAHRGTLFLDEVGLATPEVQQMLLHVMEGRPFRRAGDLRERVVDVRFILATNENLEQRVDEGLFRGDLRDRIGAMTLRLPSLAERHDEILPLARQFLAEVSREWRLSRPPTLSGQVEDLFLASTWPGNIRQLKMICRSAAALATPRDEIRLEDLDLDFVACLGKIARTRHDQATSRRSRARRAVEEAKGNKSEAARQLGISRTALYNMLGEADSIFLGEHDGTFAGEV